MPSSTRSRACRSWGCRSPISRSRLGSSSAHSTPRAAAGLLLLSPALRSSRASRSSSIRAARFSSARCGWERRDGLPCLQVPHDGRRRRARKDDVAHLNMHRDGDPRMFKIPDDPRVTRVGGFLRRSRRRAAAADQRRARRDVARRAAAAHSRRGPACHGLGAQAARPEAGHHRPVAGARA